MISKIGPRRRTNAKIVRRRRATFHATWMDITISTAMATGRPIPITARCGFRRALRLAGRRIATATGFGLDRGAGPGWQTSRGVSRHFTTGAGHTWAADIGAGW